MRSRLIAAAAALVAAAALALACSGRDDLDGRRRAPPGLPDRPDAYIVPAGGAAVAVDLFDSRAAAVVHDAGALVVEAGSAGFATYVEGGYRSPWWLGRDGGGRRAALINGLAGDLYAPIDRDPGGVVRTGDGGVRVAFFARAAATDQLVSVFLNEQRLGDVPMPTVDWQWYEVTAPADAVREGENKLRFYFRHAGEIDGARSAAAIATVAFGGRPTRALALHAGPVARAAGQLDALSVAGPSRLSFYVQVPERAPRLVLAHVGPGAELSIAARPEHGDLRLLWRSAGGADWTPVTIDLSAMAGQVIRLDLLASGAADWGRPRLMFAPPEPPSERGDAVADNVILWTISSLRLDRLGEATPNLRALAAGGALFRGLVPASSAPGLVHAAMMTGRYPDGARVEADATTLGERFLAAGYATALVSGNGFVHDELGFAQGMSRYENPMRQRQPFGGRALWQRAKAFIAERDGRKTMAYVATVEPQLPYTPTPEALAAVDWAGQPARFSAGDSARIAAELSDGKRAVSAEDRAYLRALYDGAVRDADAAVGQLVADLASLDLAKRTAIIVVGEHGEELFERGGLGHGGTLYREALSTPLIVWFPAGVSPRVVDTPVQSVDIYATALDLAGISLNPEAQGRSLLPLARGGAAPREPAFAQVPDRLRSVEAGGYKLVVPRYGPAELYEHATDPDERHDRVGELPIAERYLRNLFGLHVAFEPAWKHSRWGTAAAMTPAFAADQGL